MRNNMYLNSARTSLGDEVVTPRYAVEPIIKYILNKGYKTVWAPFDKEHSFYVRCLRKVGLSVICSHISDGKDFFTYEPKQYDIIVSNPPFSLKTAILKRVYELDKPFALLLPQNCLQATSRTGLFIKHGLEYLGFDKRVCFYTRDNMDSIRFGNHFASGYFCRHLLPEKLMFEELQPIQESYWTNTEENICH